jgi:hypothetical protein
MPDKENSWRVLGRELRPHAIWEVIKWVVTAAGSAMIPLILALWQKSRHVPLDWIVLGGLFVVSFVIFAAGIGVLLYVGGKIGSTAKGGSLASEAPAQDALVTQSETPMLVRTNRAEELSPLPDEPTLISLSPQELVRLFKTGGTTAQSNRLIQPYVGKWMQISVVVDDVTHFGPDTNQVSVTGPMGLGLHILLYFRKKWAEEVSMLVKGQNITLRGQFESIAWGDTVRLVDCELLAKRRS